MLPLLQLLIAVFAIYSALKFSEEARLLVPLGCLILMFIISQIEKRISEDKIARKSILRAEIDILWKRNPAAVKKEDFFTIESLIWPKSEFLLIDSVHFIFKDLGFRVSGANHYKSVDRIVKIPDSSNIFGLEVLMSEGEVDKNHLKIIQALQFEKDKKEEEKTLIVGSTHTQLPLSERSQVNPASKELADVLISRHISFIAAHHLYELYQKAKSGRIDILKVFQKVYLHPGGIFYFQEPGNSSLLSYATSVQ